MKMEAARSTRQHGVTSQETANFIVPAERTSNLIQHASIYWPGHIHPLMWIQGLHCNALYNPPTLTQFNALHELRIIEERSDNWFYEYLILRFSKPHHTYSDTDFEFDALVSPAI
jgi:hypothetical protein